MFDYSLMHWVTFFTAAVLLNVSPGPDMAFILGQTVRGGKRSGFLAMFGIWTGTFFHVLLAATGLSAILFASDIVFSFVKWIGVIYLVWLGIVALRSNEMFVINCHDVYLKKIDLAFKQGVFIAALNPKVAIFFLAFLPQFVVEGAGSQSAQLFLHGMLIIVVAGFVEPPLILAGSKLTTILRNNNQIGVWLDRALGLLFIFLAIRLAFSQ